ncbi:MAG TPA: NmrA family NAD(P)-binding protein, partial [Gemmatimonadaceae bacterium]
AAMSRFVIAAGTGRVGSSVARTLLTTGNDVAIISRSAERGASLAASGADVAEGNLGDAAFLSTALEDGDALLAVLPEPLDVVDFHGERRRLVDVIATAIARSNLAHVVVLSSVGAHIAEKVGPISDLHYFERAILGTGKPVTVLRGSMFQDNVASAVEPARMTGTYVNLQPDRDRAIPMVAIRDVAAIAATLLTQAPGENPVVIDVMGPAYSASDVAAQLGRALGRSLQIVDVPPSEHVPLLTRMGLPLPFAQAIAELQKAIASGWIEPAGDRRETGTTTLEQTLNGILNATTPVMSG